MLRLSLLVLVAVLAALLIAPAALADNATEEQNETTDHANVTQIDRYAWIEDWS